MCGTNIARSQINVCAEAITKTGGMRFLAYHASMKYLRNITASYQLTDTPIFHHRVHHSLVPKKERLYSLPNPLSHTTPIRDEWVNLGNIRHKHNNYLIGVINNTEMMSPSESNGIL